MAKRGASKPPSMCAGLLESWGWTRPRSRWSAIWKSCRARPMAQVALADGDRLEIVHFIGGGNAPVEVPRVDKPLVIAGKTYKSRLIIGTGKYKDYADNAAALEASGAEIVTVAVRRVNLTDPQPAHAGGFHRSEESDSTCPTPPAASPARTRCAPCAWRARRAAGSLVKLEVLGEKKLLYPDMIETLRATEMLSQGRLPGDGLLQRRSLDGQAAGRCRRGGDHAAGVADRFGHGHAGHREHPHDHRGRQGAGDRGCRHRHRSDAAVAMELGCDAVSTNTGIAHAAIR